MHNPRCLATVRVTIIYDDRPICNSDSCRYSTRKRAKIGAYATKHGAATAAKHFSKQLCHSVKESIVKLIRNAYKDASNKEIKSQAILWLFTTREKEKGIPFC